VDVIGSRNFLITADFPAYLRRDIERERGGTAILFVGAQGDLYPIQSIEDHHDEKGLRTYEEAEKLGSAIARACLDALKDVKTTADANLAVRVAYPELPIENRMFKILRLLRILRRPTHKGMIRAETWVVDIGDAQIVTLPGQFFCKLGQEIKSQMKGPHSSSAHAMPRLRRRKWTQRRKKIPLADQHLPFAGADAHCRRVGGRVGQGSETT
jgi:hypothetical protein